MLVEYAAICQVVLATVLWMVQYPVTILLAEYVAVQHIP